MPPKLKSKRPQAALSIVLTISGMGLTVGR